MKAWQWVKVTPTYPARTAEQWELRDGRKSPRAWATIWRPFKSNTHTWHTWDYRDGHVQGVGGENASANSLSEAQDQVVAALVRQGWTPGGWQILW